MLIDFFYTLRAAKLPVSVKEYLTLLEALKADVVGPLRRRVQLDDFYYLARTALVKDEKHFDKFDRAFAAYFKGVELLADFTKDVPLDWLRKKLERELTPEEKAKIEKMGWDELMETLKKRFEEQKERHEGGSKWIGTGGTSPFGARRLQPAGHPHRRRGQQQERGEGVGPARLQGLRRHARSWARATSRSRCGGCASFAREGARGRARPRRHDPLDRRQRRLARHQDACPSGTTTSRCCC